MRFDMTKYREAHLVLKIFQRYHFLIGLKRTKFQNDILICNGNHYKIYSSLFLLIFTLISLHISFINNSNTKIIFSQSISIRVMNFVNFYLVIVTLVVTLFQSIYIDPKLTCKIYKTLFKIEDFLEHSKNNTSSKSKMNIVAFYVPFLLFKLIYVLFVQFFWPEYKPFSYHATIFIIDLELMRFVIESNLVTEKLKSFNKILMKVKSESLRRKKLYFESLKGNEAPLKALVNVHILFYDIFEDLSSCYGSKVCISLLK